jgi:hypothetical protein
MPCLSRTESVYLLCSTHRGCAVSAFGYTPPPPPQVGYTRKVGFRLTLVPLNQSPSRDQPGKAAPLPAPTSKAPANVPLPAGSPKTPANAPQATLRLLEDIPVAGKTVVFSRKDLQAVLSPRVNKLSPNRPAAGGAAAVSGQGADLKAGSPSKPAGVNAGAREEPQF